jgi:hypothetical protein
MAQHGPTLCLQPPCVMSNKWYKRIPSDVVFEPLTHWYQLVDGAGPIMCARRHDAMMFSANEDSSGIPLPVSCDGGIVINHGSSPWVSLSALLTAR